MGVLDHHLGKRQRERVHYGLKRRAEHIMVLLVHRQQPLEVNVEHLMADYAVQCILTNY